jgi:gluconokinase
MLTQPSAPQPPFVLTLDVGSSSTRAALYDATATLVPNTMAQEKRRFHVAPDGAAEDDPVEALKQVVRCINQVLRSPLAKQIAAVGCGTYVSNILGTNADGEPRTPIYTYADTRGDAAADSLCQQLNERDVWQRTGTPLRTSYLPALFSWLKIAQPQQFRQAERWMTLGEWLFDQFFGRSIITYSAAAWTGLLNRHTLQWDRDLLDYLQLDPAQLGTLADVDRATQGVQEPWASRWPQLRDVPWFSAIGDGAAANVGSGCVGVDRVALSIGTTGALRVALDREPAIPQGLWCYSIDRMHPLLGGATNEGGSVLDWVRHKLGVDPAELNAALLDSAPANHGLTVLPFLAGERAPGWAGDVDATITGIRGSTSTLDLARAALEGVSYRWAQIAALLRPALGSSPVIVASGGALRHVPGWAQLVADALDLPVALSAETEATSRGIALLALRSIGVIERLDQYDAAMNDVVAPRAEYTAYHREAIEQQKRLYERLIA